MSSIIKDADKLEKVWEDYKKTPTKQLKDNLLIACVTRNSKASIVNGKTVIEPGDAVIVLTTNKGYKDIKDIIK